MLLHAFFVLRGIGYIRRTTTSPGQTVAYRERDDMKIPRRLAAALLVIAVFGSPVLLDSPPAAATDLPQARRADAHARISADAQHIADWAVHSGDHKGLPFIVVDKVHAQAAAFDRTGRLIRTTPVLVGMGVGDVFEPGVLDLDMYATKPSQRITPAGRFFAEEDFNLDRERVLWVDYDAGIALHKMPTKKTKQRRAQRMVSKDPSEHRITYGCINVPAAFYDRVVRPHFSAKGGIVYVLPDSTPLRAVFNSYDVGERQLSSADQAHPVAFPSHMQQF